MSLGFLPVEMRGHDSSSFVFSLGYGRLNGPSKRSGGAPAHVVVGTLVVLFVVAQSLAVGVRFAQTTGALFGILEALAVLAALCLGVVLWWSRVSRLPARHFEMRKATGKAAWLVSHAPETRRAVEQITSGRLRRLPALFVVELRDGNLCMVAPHQSAPIVGIPIGAVQDVSVGHTRSIGGASECLMVTINSAGGRTELPLVLQRENPPYFLTQESDSLSHSRVRLEQQLASARRSLS